jgi:hypothetical protein
MSDEDVQALVVDNGSGMCKVSQFELQEFQRRVALNAAISSELHVL